MHAEEDGYVMLTAVLPGQGSTLPRVKGVPILFLTLIRAVCYAVAGASVSSDSGEGSTIKWCYAECSKRANPFHDEYPCAPCHCCTY
jgi:hypothetical protein